MYAPWSQAVPGLPAPMNPVEQWPTRIHNVVGWASWSDKRKLRMLRTIAQQYGRDPRLRDFTIRHVVLPSGAQPRDFRAQAAAILSWTQTNINYFNEPGEQIQSPPYTLRVLHGDCDDMAVLMAAMAESIRLPWRFVLAGKNAFGQMIRASEHDYFPPGARFSHIYVDLGWPPFSEGQTVRDPRTGRRRPATQWLAAEPTIQGVPLGHDVVLHGIPARARMGELAGFTWGEAGAGASDAAASIVPVTNDVRMFATATNTLPQTAPPAQRLPMPPAASSLAEKARSFAAGLDWKAIAVGTLQYTASALLVRLLLVSYHGRSS